MKRILVFLILFISTLLLSATDSQGKDFTSKKLGISLSVPKDWDIEESKCDPLLSLYSPETKEHPNKTLDLERGLKMELSEMGEKSFKEMMEGIRAEKFAMLAADRGKKDVTIYLEKGTYGGANIICLHTLIKEGDKNIWVIGYIPEKEKLYEYCKKYIFILTSLTFIEQTKSDSK